MLPTLLHPHQLYYATNTSASSLIALCYQRCCIVTKFPVLSKLLHPHQMHCTTNTITSSPAVLYSAAHSWYQYRYCTSTEPREACKFLHVWRFNKNMVAHKSDTDNKFSEVPWLLIGSSVWMSIRHCLLPIYKCCRIQYKIWHSYQSFTD